MLDFTTVCNVTRNTLKAIEFTSCPDLKGSTLKILRSAEKLNGHNQACRLNRLADRLDDEMEGSIAVMVRMVAQSAT